MICSPSDIMNKDFLTRQMDEVLIFFFILGINLMKGSSVSVSSFSKRIILSHHKIGPGRLEK